MWCIQTIDEEYRKRMNDILDLYSRRGKHLHIIAVDEKPKEIHSDRRDPIRMTPGHPEKYDYEYRRNGKANIFVSVDPNRGRRIAKVTRRRTKSDFALFVRDILDECPRARKIDIVLDNLNTHFAKSITETFSKEEGERMISRIRFHYTPKHASWLNIAEIEINAMDIECTGKRFQSYEALEKSVMAWQKRRNRKKAKIKWTFTQEKAELKLSKYYTI